MSESIRLQEVYNELRELKEERKKLKESIKDELKHHERHEQVLDEMNTLKAEKKMIETQVREAAPKDAQRLDEIAVEIKSNEELLSDLAFNLLMKNETVELTDKEANRYVPQFVVKFKKEGYSDEKPKEE
jgi:hypothetical protein